MDIPLFDLMNIFKICLGIQYLTQSSNMWTGVSSSQQVSHSMDSLHSRRCLVFNVLADPSFPDLNLKIYIAASTFSLFNLRYKASFLISFFVFSYQYSCIVLKSYVLSNAIIIDFFSTFD